MGFGYEETAAINDHWGDTAARPCDGGGRPWTRLSTAGLASVVGVPGWIKSTFSTPATSFKSYYVMQQIPSDVVEVTTE